MRIHFNRPYVVGNELEYITQAVQNLHLAGDGIFTKKCSTWLEVKFKSPKVLLTQSCTAALEMAAILAEIEPGDEIIMPSYTFVSTANAFVLRGGVPVFVDIREDTLNIDESKIEQAITRKTKVIVPVHYAGVACEMSVIMKLADKYNLLVIEDAAQGFNAKYNGQPLGSIGHMAAVSFHETKNVISGEGGALLINDARFAHRAEIIREKGTNRSSFFRGETDKYTWVDIGSSYLPSEVTAAFLWAQLEKADEITAIRLKIWQTYHESFLRLESEHLIRRPIIPANCLHNAHMYYLLLNEPDKRDHLIYTMKSLGIGTIFHYVPLHSSPAGRKYGRVSGSMEVTERLSSALIRLPLWINIEHDMLLEVIESITIQVRKEENMYEQGFIGNNL